MPCKPYLLFILQDVRAHLSCALSSYQIEPAARDIPENYTGIEALQTLQSQLFILRDVRANLRCALSSYQIEPTARDIPHNYIGIEALQTLSVMFILRDV